jgi:carbon monoxide dehydrogenase subunit G
MSIVRASIEIAAPIEEVWETIMDPTRLGDWVTIHRSISNCSPDPVARGAQMDQVLHIRGVSFKVHWTLRDVREPRIAQWEGHGPARSEASIRYELSTAGEAAKATRFDYTNEFRTPGGVLGNVASRVIVGGVSEREARNSLQRLKQLLERR